MNAPSPVFAATPHIVVPPPGPLSRAGAASLAALESPAFDARRKAREATSGEDFAAIVYAAGQGATLTDVDGNRYVDLVAGFGALPLGYGHPALAASVQHAWNTLPLALGDVYAAADKLALATALVDHFQSATGAAKGRLLFGLSGADAVTGALKTVALRTKKPGVIAFDGGYHGLSHGPLAACGLAPKFREPFVEQLSKHVQFAPYPTTDAVLDRALTAVKNGLSRGDAGAVLVEPILGRGGCVVPPAAFLTELRALCTETDTLLVLDEIWTGCGRTGLGFFAGASAKPDLICLGKALGGGMPISVCLGTEEAFEPWGSHGGSYIHTATHFGAPPGCAAALAVLGAIDDGDLIAANSRKGALFQTALAAHGFSVQGAGMMLGIPLRDASTALAATRRLLQAGYLVLTGGRDGNVITLSPSFVLDDAAIVAFAEVFATLVPPEARR